ncbi:MAG: hypothetical protein ACLR9T_01700 [Thomasclavelia sp.]|uniref:hypothetical protein n=1 Tax=Thomasclavelia sp. TaxID=3025757 RepID=UPI0039A14755
MKGIIRDFSQSSLDNLRGIAKNTNDTWNLFDWFDDTFLTEELNIKDNIKDLNHYHETMMDKHNIGEYKLNQILKNVDKIDCSYSKVFNKLYDIIENHNSNINTLISIISPTHIGVETTLLKSFIIKRDELFYNEKLKILFGTDDFNEIMDKLGTKKDLSELDIQAFIYLAKLYPDKPVPPNVINNITNYINQYYNSVEDGLGVINDLIKQSGIQIMTMGKVIDDLLKPFIIEGPEGAASFLMYNNSNIGNGLILSGKLKDAGSSIIKFSKGFGLFLGFASVGLGTWDDVTNDGKTIGQGITHNLGSLGAGIGGAAAAVAIAGGPVGWAAIGIGFVGSVFATGVYDLIYDNDFLGLRSFLDEAGSFIDSSIDWCGERLSDIGEGIEEGLDWCGEKLSDIGEGVSDFVSFINPFD